MRRGLVLAALASAALSLVSGDARAIELGTKEELHPYRSAQNFALELRFSPYRPQIDEEPGLAGRTPFRDTFGPNPRLSFQLEFDWQVFRIPHVGTIGPGFGVGLVSFGRDVRTLSGRESGDQTGLTIYPFWASAVLRGDALWRDLGFPLVPYGKLGLGLGLWRATTATGTARDEAGVAGRGASWGMHTAVGLAFALDVLDRGASKSMDDALGINNTYVYAEYYWLALNGIAQDNALRVGAATWAAGLAFEF
jgi:hypothetical protein